MLEHERDKEYDSKPPTSFIIDVVPEKSRRQQ